jgi:hypothetical protein
MEANDMMIHQYLAKKNGNNTPSPAFHPCMDFDSVLPKWNSKELNPSGLP